MNTRYFCWIALSALALPGSAQAGEICKAPYTHWQAAQRLVYACVPDENKEADAAVNALLACKDYKKVNRAYLNCPTLVNVAIRGDVPGETGGENKFHFTSQQWLQHFDATGAWSVTPAIDNCNNRRDAYLKFARQAPEGKSLVFIECPNTGLFGAAWYYYQQVYNGTCKQYEAVLQGQSVCIDGKPVIRAEEFNPKKDYGK